MFQDIDLNQAPDDAPKPIDWQKCLLCQKELRGEKIISPAENTRGGAFSEEGYSTLAQNLQSFYDLGALPPDIKFGNLNDGSGIKETLSKNKAVWHKKCYLKYNATKLARAQKRVDAGAPSANTSPMKTRGKSDTSFKEDACLFCDAPASRSDVLYQVRERPTSQYIIENAKLLCDRQLMAKVAERSDLLALEAKYHPRCYASFRNRVRDKAGKAGSSGDYLPDNQQKHSLAFAGLVSYIMECRTEETPSPIFKLSELAKMYEGGLKDLGVDSTVNRSKLKEKLLEACPCLQACDKVGTTSLIAFRTDIDHAVRDLCGRNYEDEAEAFSKAARVVREDIFRAREDADRDATLIPSNSAPSSLVALVKMIINGPSLRKKEDNELPEETDKVAESIAQLLAFNTVKYHKDGGVRRHSRNQETSVPVYTAMKLYGDTRMKRLIDINFRLGLCVSYARMISMLTEKANQVCSIYHSEEVVCPPSLRKGVFTTACVDNIDHNTSATFATSSFHGTALTLMQHFKKDETGHERIFPPPSKELRREQKTLLDLPESYAVVQPCFVDVKNAMFPYSNDFSDDFEKGESPYVEEKGWFENVDSDDITPWAPFHAKTDIGTEKHTTKIAILPLFTEEAHSAAMMMHSAKVVTKAINHLNPGQTPVLVADQPLYALLKQIQFQFPHLYGEDKLFVLMGGLHLEMAALRMLGKWLEGSGWVETLVQSSVTTQGRAESFISASHVTRTRYAHQVTAAVLHKLQRRAYDDYLITSEDGDLSFDEWRATKCASIPQFKYWDTTLMLELNLLQFVRAIRTADFTLYKAALRRLVPWFFSLDLVNYARWVPVHLRDLVIVQQKNPGLYTEFNAGHFVARKTGKPFSAMALDQAHEQSNALLKGDGGMVGLTENPDALRKWIVAGPEIAECVDSFEEEWSLKHESETALHHSDNVSTKTRFKKDVENLEKLFDDLGNPFLEESSDLYNIDSKRIASPKVVDTVNAIEALGEKQYTEFVNERLCSGKKKLMDTLKQNNHPLFTFAEKATKTKEKITGLKSDCSLFSKLYIATSEHRSGDLDNFFAHENQPSPPSLSANGELRPGKKSDLLKCLLAASPECLHVGDAPVVEAKIFDGPALVHMLHPGQSRTFQEYAEKIFIPFLKKELLVVRRIDVIWDRYIQDSLKSHTRMERGDGIRTRVAAATRIPKGWPNFLRNSENKKELFQFLNTQIMAITQEAKEVYCTEDSSVLSSPRREDMAMLSPCNHEEADTRIMVHVADCVKQGHKKILVRTVDTDVLAIAVSIMPKLTNTVELWIHIGTGRNHQYLAAHRIAQDLGTEKATCLALFHALSGCDTVSSFSNKGKKSAFDAWKAYPDATKGFLAAQELDYDKAFPFIEKWVITMYDRSSTSANVNECRKELFTKKSRPLEGIPPTRDALEQHSRRGILQGAFVWGQCLAPIQDLPSPSEWGWEKCPSGWSPKWTTIPIATKACLELIRCGCKSCATRPGQCVCRKRQLKCTELCSCDAKC